MNLSTSPHRRFNPLLKSWVLVSPQRMTRPWAGKTEKATPTVKDEASNNPLRPNAVRSNGERNPNYQSIYVFKNDFPALLDTSTSTEQKMKTKDFDFFHTESAEGTCQVMCFHPSSNVTLATMKLDDVIGVINKWASIIKDEGSKYEWIQIFENHGELMGCSNPHPHCQIWSTKYLPNFPSIKDVSQKEYFNKYKSSMLYDYVMKEIEIDTRIVHMNDGWVCLVPFWAEWPYETMLVPRRRDVHRLTDLSGNEVNDLAVIMQTLLRKYNKLFETEFPYSMGWHGAPTGSYLDKDTSYWTLHAVYFPPLLRSETIKKFFVGFELLAETQRDLTPERAAETLRDLIIS